MRERQGYTPPHDIFVPKHLEQNYCRDHNIEFRQLPNGITLLGIPRRVEDMMHASVDFLLPSGAFFDPPGKSGLHHFLEHIVSSEAVIQAHADNHLFNASTSVDKFALHAINAVANPAFTNYGIWPVLINTRRLFNNPFYLIQDMENAIQKERGVILGEMTEQKYGDAMRFALYKIVFDPRNPKIVNPLGTAEDIQGFTPMDMYATAQELFKPQGLVISTFTEGDLSLCRTVTDNIESLFGDYQPGNDQPRVIEPTLYDMLNPNLKPGSKDRISFGGETNITNVNLVWNLPCQPFSASESAFSDLSDTIKARLFAFMRRNGFGYSSDVSILRLNTRKLFQLTFGIPHGVATEADIVSQVIPRLVSNVIGDIKRDDAENSLRQSRTEIEATPMTIREVYETLIELYRKSGRIIDIDKTKQVILDGLNADLTMQLKDELMAQEPSTILLIK